jgi:hypothetical protein
MKAAWSNVRGNGKSTGDAGSESDRLRAEVDATHRRLEGLLGELDRRRREAFDVRLQMRRHPVAFAVGAALAVGAMGGGATLVIARMRRQRRQRRSRGLRLQRLWRLSGRPDVIHDSGSGRMGWLLTTAAKVAAAILVRRFGGRARRRRS